MTSLDSLDDSLTKVHAPASGVLMLNLEGMREFSKRCPERSSAIEECSAFVNWRRIEVGEPPVLVRSAGERVPAPSMAEVAAALILRRQNC